jgi:hypothetical protein
MPDIGGQLLDVALGLTFIFLVLSLVCSLFQELIATALSWRAEFLERGIRRMLCDPAEPRAHADRAEQGLRRLRGMFSSDDKDIDRAFSDKLLKSPFIREKLAPNMVTARRAVPSYLSSRTFALALFDTLTHNREGADVIAKIDNALEDDGAVPHKGVRRQLRLMLDDAEKDLEGFHQRVEAWYDDTMERVSGWYRRRAQLVLFMIGLLVASFANADTFDVTNRLWTDQPVRAALVQQATEVAQVENLDALEAELEKRGGRLEAVKQFKLPLGWNEDNGRVSDLGFGEGKENLLGWLAGILVAAVALSFGAPFWFDALNKLGRIRISGRRPDKAAGSS